jgi:hypothetical protein
MNRLSGFVSASWLRACRAPSRRSRSPVTEVSSTSGSTPQVNPASGAKTALLGLQSPQIPVNRLVAYVNDQEAGNWFGISYLRLLFKHWVRKDRLLRVDAINAERNGAGVPLAYAPPNASKDQMTALANLARSYRAGESAGGALPNGAELRFRGVEGTLPDVLASVRYDDEQMAARFMAQFSKLGTSQTGSYALGQTLMRRGDQVGTKAAKIVPLSSSIAR